MKGRLTFHYKSFCTILISDYFPVFSIYTERGEKEALKKLSDKQPLPCLTADISNLPHSPQTPYPVAYSENISNHINSQNIANHVTKPWTLFSTSEKRKLPLFPNLYP